MNERLHGIIMVCDKEGGQTKELTYDRQDLVDQALLD